MAEPDNFLSRWSRRKLDARADTAVPVGPAVPAAPAVVPTPADRPALPSDESTAASQTIAAATDDETAQAPAAAEAPAPPTLDDVALLDRESSYSRFVARDVSPDVRNAAMKKLFSDPHYNVMDGLDIYIDDYGKPDPLPAGMLRQMVQSKMLGLFAAEDAADEAAAAAARSDIARGAVRGGKASPATDAGMATATEPAPDDLAQGALTAIDAADSGVADTAAQVQPAPEAATSAIAPDEDTHMQLQPVDDAGRAGAGTGTRRDPGRQHGRTG